MLSPIRGFLHRGSMEELCCCRKVILLVWVGVTHGACVPRWHSVPEKVAVSRHHQEFPGKRIGIEADRQTSRKSQQRKESSSTKESTTKFKEPVKALSNAWKALSEEPMSVFYLPLVKVWLRLFMLYHSQYLYWRWTGERKCPKKTSD